MRPVSQQQPCQSYCRPPLLSIAAFYRVLRIGSVMLFPCREKVLSPQCIYRYMVKGLVVDLAEWRVEAAQSRRHWADKMWVLGSSGSRYMLGFFPIFSFFWSITRTWTKNPACGRSLAQALVVDKSWRRFFSWYTLLVFCHISVQLFFSHLLYTLFTLYYSTPHFTPTH